MVKHVTVLGGSGIFGSRIASALARHPGVHVRIAGRNARKGERLASLMGAEFRPCNLKDRTSLRDCLRGAYLVIHAAGPFQDRDYTVAEVCLELGAHYVDIADARHYVMGIRILDKPARDRGLFVTSGASSVPAITYSLIDSVRSDFHSIEEIQVALAPGNQNPRGASTIAAILTYLGRPIPVWQQGTWCLRPGWGDMRLLRFPPKVGWRRVYNCDVPDLELFPHSWGARTVSFHAGLELGIFNYLLFWIGRARKYYHFERLPEFAPWFLRLSLLLYPFGSKNGSLAVWVRGLDLEGRRIERNKAIVTGNDGPATPSAAATVLARKMVERGPPCTGAHPCVGFVALEELMEYLRPLGIWCVPGEDGKWHDVHSPRL